MRRILGKILIKNSKDTQQLLISHCILIKINQSIKYICNWVNDVTWLQIKWNISKTKHGTKNVQNKLLIYTVLRELSKIKRDGLNFAPYHKSSSDHVLYSFLFFGERISHKILSKALQENVFRHHFSRPWVVT
jgi:hypothetical protein